MVSIVNKKDIKFSPRSFMDDFGRVFFYKGKIYRRISQERTEYCLNLLNSALFKELTEKKLIPETIISNDFEGEVLVLQHQNILQSLQHEWSYEMFKDAALMVLEVNDICKKYGYELKDAHTMNVLYHNTRPVFVDIGSIDLIKENSQTVWRAYDEFLHSFFLPLLFWSEGNHFVVRKLLESNFYKIQTLPFQTLSSSGLLDLLTFPTSINILRIRNKEIFKTENRIKGLNFSIKMLRRIRKKLFIPSLLSLTYEKRRIEPINLFPLGSIKKNIRELKHLPKASMWARYHEINYGSPEFLGDNTNHRFTEIIKILDGGKNINTVLDLAGNEGYFSILLAKNLSLERIILADNDENAVDRAFLNFKEQKINNATPLLLNFMFTIDVEGTSERLKSDLVVALAITHHLILTEGFSLPAIIERLYSLSNRFVMVEFMPLGLWSPSSETLPPVPDWYTVEWFRDEFQKIFNPILEKKLERNRILFYGEKRLKE